MPTDKIEISEKAVSAIASSAERFIGYAYAGILPAVLLAFEDPAKVKKIVDSLGGVLSAISCFVVGIGVFTIYSKIIGELFLFPFQHAVQHLIDKMQKKTSRTGSSPVWLLRSYGVSAQHARRAYTKVRGVVYKGQENIDIQVSHGELHVLYLTAVSLVVASMLLRYLGNEPSPFYIAVASIVYLAALVVDTKQHAIEAACFIEKSDEVKNYLKQEGLIK